MKIVASFPERMDEIMRIRKIKQVDVCKVTGISATTLSRYMQGVRVPKSSNLYAIADALGVSDRWLTGYDVDMNYNPAQVIAQDHISTLTLLNEEEAITQLRKLLQCYEDTTGIEYSDEALKEVLRYCSFVAGK